MNNEDDFEKLLRQQTQRPIPSDWRKEILSAARSNGSKTETLTGSTPSILALFRSRLSDILWPHPTAWAGLAAIWVIILGLKLVAWDGPGNELTSQTTQLSPEVRQMLKNQQQLLTELVGPFEKRDFSQSKPVAPQPRSQRLEKFTNA